MAIAITSVVAARAPNQWVIHATVDGEPTSARASVNRDATGMTLEEGFFMLLSERALAEVGSSTAYHVAIIQLLQQAAKGEAVSVPLLLGQTC